MDAITIHIINEPSVGVKVLTTTSPPRPGEALTPAGALATDLLSQCARRATGITYWRERDKALELVNDILSPDQWAWAVSREVRDAARRVVGIPPCESARRIGLDLASGPDVSATFVITTNPDTDPNAQQGGPTA